LAGTVSVVVASISSPSGAQLSLHFLGKARGKKLRSHSIPNLFKCFK
jgi:hypothetical protein